MTSKANLVAFAARYDIMVPVHPLSGRDCDRTVFANHLRGSHSLVPIVVVADRHGRITARPPIDASTLCFR